MEEAMEIGVGLCASQRQSDRRYISVIHMYKILLDFGRGLEGVSYKGIEQGRMQKDSIPYFRFLAHQGRVCVTICRLERLW